MQDADDSTHAAHRARTAADEAPGAQRRRMLSGYQIGRALRFAVDLDLATILVDGPCSLEDLAVFTETDRGLLERNIRRLESVGVFRMDGSTVEITEFGASLARDDVTAALDTMVFETEVSEVEAFDTGVPDVVQAAKAVQADESVSIDDALVVSSVLNDWTYDDFNRILGTLAAATAPGGRLLLIELVVPPDGVVAQVGNTDPLMVSALGGRGHTEAEWTSVLAANGFRLERIRPGVPPFSFLEAVRH